ncbi:MAG TPA: hypothetical protein PLF56_11495 [Micropruina sp.]|nr:hypothetical protein [Micropruina sp.]
MGIARELVISPRTVDAPRSIFAELGIAASSDENARVLAVLSRLSDPAAELVPGRGGPR